MPRNADHVVASKNGSEFKCKHCGAAQPMAMPCELGVYVAASEAFLKNHRDCPPPPADPAADPPVGEGVPW